MGLDYVRGRQTLSVTTRFSPLLSPFSRRRFGDDISRIYLYGIRATDAFRLYLPPPGLLRRALFSLTPADVVHLSWRFDTWDLLHALLAVRSAYRMFVLFSGEHAGRRILNVILSRSFVARRTRALFSARVSSTRASVLSVAVGLYRFHR